MKTSAIIVGAGPAGAGASFFLSKFEIPHVVIDKATFPRDKVCGDACSGKTALVIERANPDWLKEIHENSARYLPSSGLIFEAPNGKTMEISFAAGNPPGAVAPNFIVKRLIFDNFLLEKMVSPYCTILQGSVITKIDKSLENVRVTLTQGETIYEISAPIIIGADGDKSLVKKTFKSEHIDPKSYGVGLRAYYDGITGIHPENFIELHFLPEISPGYLWIFPLPGGQANVGVGFLSESIRKKKINLREKMLYALAQNPQIAPRFAKARLLGKIDGWGLPLGLERKQVSGDRYLLTGDAASLVDPFSGEGIGNALYSGMVAAMAIKSANEANDYSADFLENAYDKDLYARVGPELQISASIQRLSQYPWLFNFVVNKANKSISLRNTISAMFSNLDLREELGKPSFYFKILFNR